ncbi:MFS transporter [Pseudoteredinibacter isoporae]|uniref:MFS transporter n=1 Tax=Pseudoteredinibacter isoporae TaxID=570281 RepID=UPI00310AEB9E
MNAEVKESQALQYSGWRSPYVLLALMTIAMPLAFSTWYALLNNFVVERAQYTGADIGLLQSVREIPGFLAFTAVFVLLVLREQRFAILALLTLGLGVSLTGFFPSSMGLLCTTFLMSVGFHYFETLKKSLALQWLPKDQAPALLGKLLGLSSASSLVVYGFIIWQPLGYESTYLLGGGLCIVLALFMFLAYPLFPEREPQHKRLFLRRRYWLYYALVFMSGARRQIFMVFAGFMMVEKFHYDVSDIATLYLINHAINSVIAAPIGRWINRVGERTALSVEYIGLILVFISYAFVDNAELAAGLYIIDHLFFSMAIAINSYFQKIADPKDIAATSGVSFTINHIAAVVIPVSFGLLWMTSSAAVFLLGAAMALGSLMLARKIPSVPGLGNEVR